MFLPVDVRQSTIFGRGLFPRHFVARGTIVCSFTTESKVMTEDEYVEAISSNRHLIVRTGTRYVGKIGRAHV